MKQTSSCHRSKWWRCGTFSVDLSRVLQVRLLDLKLKLCSYYDIVMCSISDREVGIVVRSSFSEYNL